MAWYVLYKWFIPWMKTPYTNMISMYKQYLYDEWYNSLTDEQKIKVKEYQERKEANRKKELYKSLFMIRSFIETYGKFIT